MPTIVEVLGPGCRRCEELARIVREVSDTAGIQVELRTVTDPSEIVRRGFFMRTPGLVVDGVVLAAGRVPNRRQLDGWLRGAAGMPEAPPDPIRGRRPLNPFGFLKQRSRS